MAGLLKDLYNPRFFEELCPLLKEEIPDFDCRDFIFRVFNNAWPDLELKSRIRHIAKALHHFLTLDFAHNTTILIRICNVLKKRDDSQNFLYLFIPDYIELFCLDHPDSSLKAMEQITKLVSAEFAVRPFLIRYPDQTMRCLYEWSLNTDPYVRRLSSEGCRPRLPWAMGIPSLKKDPTPIFPILENLKADPSEYVRRSVANNLNDIARDHPDLVISLANRWHGSNPLTDQIIRHGSRNLLKKGNEQMLSLHGLAPASKAAVKKLMHPPSVRIGDHLTFQFAFISKEPNPAPFRLDYAIDYLTSTGKCSRKVFRISEKIFSPGETVIIQRKQSFRNLTTRRHYKGKHNLRIIANGKELAQTEFIVH